MAASPTLLSDPFLQLPTETAVRVVWFTEFPGTGHRVAYGENLDRVAPAVTTRMSRLREDPQSRTIPPWEGVGERPIWRHEAEARNLKPGQRVPYRVFSIGHRDGVPYEVSSAVFTLAPQPPPGTPLKILLTSDHQLMPMVAANLQKVEEVVGRVDGVFFAGDLVNVADRASEWFDDSRGRAFFPCLQGRARSDWDRGGKPVTYRGGQLIQHAPLFPAIGNHEVMGRFSPDRPLNEQFEDSFPRWLARQRYREVARQVNPTADPQLEATWLKDHSFNSDTYEEIFSLPADSPGGKRYYALTFGDVRLITLYVTHMWRSPSRDRHLKGRYQEAERYWNQPENWGWGQHIFEPIAVGSQQYRWLERELQSPAFQKAPYKLVMFHHPAHTLGGNIVPPYTDPIPRIERAAGGPIESVAYDYPPDRDYIVRDLLPLLESAGVQLAFYGHSHLWNRFRSPGGTHFLESSNVGNTYGAHWGDNRRPLPPHRSEGLAAVGNPNGLDPILPTLAPLTSEGGQPLPYLASNDITGFSILETETGTVSSFRFDPRCPDSAAVKFDAFRLN